jgi:diguanylate cyclase (GGDEF)-like protein/PAS domain S-box-containing protein
MPATPRLPGHIRGILRPALAYTLVAVGLAVGIVYSLLLWQTAAERLRHNEELEFQQQAERLVRQTQFHLNLYRAGLNSVRGLFLSSDEVTREEFSGYINALDLLRNYPGLRAMGFNRYVTPEQLPAFTARTAKSLAQSAPHLPPFQVFPPGDAPHHLVVEYIEPLIDNARALGRDLYTDRARQNAVDYALRHDFSATGPINLAQHPSRPAVLLNMPVFPPPQGGPRRMDRLKGTVSASFVLDTFFDQVLDAREPLQLMAEDMGSINERAAPQLLYSNCRQGRNCSPAGAHTYEEQIEYGGRLWRLKVSALAAPEDSTALALSWYLLITGIAATLLFGGLAASTIRARLQAQRLHDALQERETILRTAPDGHFLTQDGRLIWGNDAFFALIGGNRRELLDQPWEPALEDLGRLPELRENLAQALRSGRPFRMEAPWRREDGHCFWSRMTATRADPEQPSKGVIWTLEDISERKAAENRITHQAHHDPLTGLANRAALVAEAERLLAQARRGHDGAAVFFIDLDRFKAINDQYGHDLGDALLMEVARRIQTTVREMDLAVRLGGDEFVVLAPQLGDPMDAGRMAARLEEALAAPYHLRDLELHSSASIGISLFPRDGENLDTLLQRADTAMYQAKTAGRDNYQFYGSGNPD